ncbi:MAG: BatD family protein [Porphyromonas sp.]|nr:BatD family protein [Porphyromonas sp.]
MKSNINNTSFKTFVLILLMFLGSAPMSYAQNKIDFSVSVQDEIYEGEQFKVSFTINASATKFKMDDPKDLSILYGPSQSSSRRTSSINGNRTTESHTTYTYVFLADKAGEYEIPSASVVVGSATYTTKSKKIKVYPASSRQDSSPSKATNQGSAGVSDKDIFVVATATKTNVYEQEGILVTFKIYSLLDFRFEDVKFPDFDGFISQDVPTPSVLQLKAEQYKGKVYRSVEIKQVYLFPQRSGRLLIPAGSFRVVISVPVQGQSDSADSFFDSFFSTIQEVRKTIKSNSINIEVKGLPMPKPEGFDGAVGQFSLSAEVPETVVKANESLKYKLTLKGSGNIKLASVPTPSYPEGFETYDPKEEDDINVTPDGVSGIKSKEFYAVPRFAGDFVVPKVDFVYFDTASRSYKTITLGEVKIHVDKGNADSQTTVANYTEKQEIKYIGKDIRYIKKSTSKTRANTPGLMLYALGYLLIVIFSLVCLVIIRSKRRDMDDLSIYKSKRAGKHARRWLKLASTKRDSGEHSAYFEALLKGLSDYLSSKLQLPLSTLSKETIADSMHERGFGEDLISRTLSTLSTLEMARYTPTGDMSEKSHLYNECAAVIETIESQKLR